MNETRPETACVLELPTGGDENVDISRVSGRPLSMHLEDAVEIRTARHESGALAAERRQETQFGSATEERSDRRTESLERF